MVPARVRWTEASLSVHQKVPGPRSKQLAQAAVRARESLLEAMV